jgi:hypothetical protein
MPHLVLCAASVPLHERPMCRARKDRHCDHNVQAHQQKCLEFGDKDQRRPRGNRVVRFWEVVQIVRGAFSNLLPPVRELSRESSLSVPDEPSASLSSLRSDLSAIRRVGFPPSENVAARHVGTLGQRNEVDLLQSSTIHSCSPQSRTVVAIPNDGMVITVPCQVLHSTSASAICNVDRSCDSHFCRIEAIFI